MIYTESLWNGYRRLDFTFEGRQAILVCPSSPYEGGRWLLKTEYFDAFPDLELELVSRGYYLAYIKNINRWGLPEDLHAKKRFRDFLVKEFGLSEKCVPVGMSCGGLFGIKLAGMYPEMVSMLYLDAPVVNILSMLDMGTPENVCGISEEEICTSMGMTRSEMIAYRDHPLDYMPQLVAERIPVCLVYGGADTVVLPAENAELIKKAYTQSVRQRINRVDQKCNDGGNRHFGNDPGDGFIQHHGSALKLTLRMFAHSPFTPLLSVFLHYININRKRQ